MAASLCSPADAHGSTLAHRRPRPRFPSLTEFPDSPSVYSHAYHTPRPDTPRPETPPLVHRSGPPDFDDEAASTLSTDGPYDDLDRDDATDDTSHRMSLQGPRIRFHSRAPWETDDDVEPHPVEPDDNPRSATIGSRLRGKAVKADTLIRTLTRGPSISSRPSADSTHSQAPSSEIVAGNYSSSRAALYDLVRESMSSSPTSPSVRQQTFAPSHHFVPTHGTYHRTAVSSDESLDGFVPSPMALEGAPILPSPSHTSRSHRERSASPSILPSPQERQCDDFVHPYANPDLAVPYTPSSETIPSHLILPDVAGSDSNSTVADSTSIKSAAFSVISAETSTTSLTSREISHRNPRINGKEISPPIPVLHQNDTSYVDRNNRFLSLHPPPSGFDVRRGNSRPPPVALITLQEAQARERVRSTTVHTTLGRSKLPFPSPDDIAGTTKDQVEEKDIVGALARTRARSTSTGSRRVPPPLPPSHSQNFETGGGAVMSTLASVVPGRAVRHKKSGFMRLFTGRSSDGEKQRSPPPPVPPLSEAYVKQSTQIHSVRKTSRTSPPALHISDASNDTFVSTNSSPSDVGPTNFKGLSSRRRLPPQLSIVTHTPEHSISSTIIGRNSSASLAITSPPPTSLAVPQSAPPCETDFLGLKLRPVSASFGSHFADMVTNTVDELRDVHTPISAASSNTALSPFTPISVRRGDDAAATALETPGEEHPSINELQDQLASAKRAWQQEIWELRGQIRDLTAELQDLRVAEKQGYCGVCGRGKAQRPTLDEQRSKMAGVVNRPRARTGDSARFASGN